MFFENHIVCDFLCWVIGLSMYALESDRINFAISDNSSGSSDVSNIIQRHLSFSESVIALSLFVGG